MAATSLDRPGVFAIVRDNLAEILECEPGSIAEGQSFNDDLEADSLALIELVEALEEDLAERGVSLRIEDEDLEDLKTVRDAVDYVYSRASRGYELPGQPPRAGADIGDADLDALSERLGYVFTDRSLLRRAMAHRSWCAEVAGGEASNERLEFLGDAVLGWVVADLAFRQFSDLPEGKLTDLRKSVVNASALAEIAVSLDIGSCLLLGRGEAAAGGRHKPSILSDAFEAVLGAIYVDAGSQAAYDFVERAITDRLRQAVMQLDRLDYKTLLQEIAVRDFDSAPVYILSEEGPDHAKAFSASVLIAGRRWGRGQGRSKKLAEQAAAAQACANLAGNRSEID